MVSRIWLHHQVFNLWGNPVVTDDSNTYQCFNSYFPWKSASPQSILAGTGVRDPQWCSETVSDLPDVIQIICHNINNSHQCSPLKSCSWGLNGGQGKGWLSETLYLFPVTPVRHSTFLNIMLIYRNSASLSYMYIGARLTTCLRRYWGDRWPVRASRGRVCTRQLGNNCCLFCIQESFWSTKILYIEIQLASIYEEGKRWMNERL